MSHISTPLFRKSTLVNVQHQKRSTINRASARALPLEEGDDYGSSGNNQNPEFLTPDIHLKLIRSEVAEKEACRLLKKLSDEAADLLKLNLEYSGINNTEEEHDLMREVMALGGLMKRLSNDKISADENAKAVQEKCNEAITAKNTTV